MSTQRPGPDGHHRQHGSRAEGPCDGYGVVVGSDGSASADEAVEWAFQQARARGVPLTIVLAWESGWSSRAAEHHQHLVDAVAARLRSGAARSAPEVEVRAVQRRGAPATVLLEEAAGAELLVVGRRNRGPLRELVLGSVSSAVLHRADRPVTVVPAMHLEHASSRTPVTRETAGSAV
ncbi:universal stress protein [Sanguibacter suaedae]|uniref:Universal stress protein n=1 Tax=Sanguibacter suaedae TaxID=2795737 RepID=A0A934MCJ0_9MICO|nr:universal stress protein [Sanguibacter suaedae]MBI9113909.1 universal stress protein [Sanguibacter suaedae]